MRGSVGSNHKTAWTLGELCILIVCEDTKGPTCSFSGSHRVSSSWTPDAKEHTSISGKAMMLKASQPTDILFRYMWMFRLYSISHVISTLYSVMYAKLCRLSEVGLGVGGRVRFVILPWGVGVLLGEQPTFPGTPIWGLGSIGSLMPRPLA